jgi:predicted membrane metal-binding protein
MDAIEHAANISVARACGFCALAIFCLMVGFSYEPHMAAQVGGMMSFAVTLVLLLKAAKAPRQPFRTTETWLILSPEDRPPPSIAQTVIGAVLRRVYLQYARYSAFAAVTLLAAAVLFKLVFG